MKAKPPPGPDLFSWAPPARASRDAGMTLAAEAQDQKDPSWRARAYEAIVSIARHQPTVHVDDVLSRFAAQPEHPNAWGAVWMRAIRDGIIEHSGSLKPCAAHRRKHAHQYPVYRSLIWQ